jgi:endonuclease/exonuclease/phosphatase family metal-dependent hydrolase
MLRRLKPTPQALMWLEAGLIGLFFIQALRFLVGMLYTRTAGASLSLTLQGLGIPAPATAPDPAIVQQEISVALAMLALPLLGLLLTRARPLIFVALLITAAGRALLNTPLVITPAMAAALTVGGGLLYLSFLVRWRAGLFPVFFVLGIAADGLFRAAGNTLDPSVSAAFATPQLALSLAAALIGLIALIGSETPPQPAFPGPAYGLMPLWGGISLGAMLFIQLSLLALPSAIAGRAGFDYAVLVPLVTLAGLLPIIPAVRARLAAFIGTFDAGVRGWLWMLVVVLLVVFGTRLSGMIAALALVAAHFMVSMIWWWLLRRRAPGDRTFGGLWMVLAVLVFALLAAADLFTYEYAYVRAFSGNLAFLNNSVVPLLRAFRGLGLAVLVLGIFLAALPITQVRQRIPWMGGTALASAAGVVLTAAAVIGALYLSRPPLAVPAGDLQTLRVGTYNIHGGVDEAYAPSLEGIARTIAESGAQIVLLQEVEAGRLTSFGVDQSLWLARRLGMDRRFFPTNEGLRGLAVLSRLPIAYDDGVLLDSLGEQTGLQRVQVQPRPDRVLEIYNTWLGYLLEPTGDLSLTEQEQDQQRQLGQVFDVIARQHPDGILGRTVIGGTFNNVPDSPLMNQMRAVGFSDPFAGLPLELSATLVRAGVPPARLDYVWLRNLTPSEGVLVLDSTASDHRLAVVGLLVE